MIPKVTRGGNTRGLLLYVIGKGRRGGGGARHDVDCVLIGGTAMQVHGHV